RVHGGKPKYYHALIGGNFRLDELQAAVLGVKLKRLDDWTAGRQRNAAFYDQAFRRAQLEGAVRTPHASLGVRHIYNQYVIRARRRVGRAGEARCERARRVCGALRGWWDGLLGSLARRRVDGWAAAALFQRGGVGGGRAGVEAGGGGKQIRGGASV